MGQFWLLLANSSKARIFEGGSPIGELNEIFDLENESAKLREEDIVTDRSGRRHDEGMGLSAMERDPLDEETNVFVREVVRFLEKHRNAGDFQTLSIIAEPQFLGKLRNEMPAPLRGLVIEEVAKNITNQRPEQFQEHLQNLH